MRFHRLFYTPYRKNRLGSLQKYVALDWNAAVYAVSDVISTRTAAAALLQGSTALAQVTESYNVQKGDTVLVHTVAGGVGLLLAQLAKARGATVIGTTSTPEKAALAKAHGTDHVILYNKENTVERVLELTDGNGANVIYDGVGKATCVISSTLRYRSYVLQVRRRLQDD
jgi:NADPH2:quinone reductase